jgi:hypothetical protein
MGMHVAFQFKSNPIGVNFMKKNDYLTDKADVDLCNAIAEIEGFEVTNDGITFNLIKLPNNGLKAYNPLFDDAVCFGLIKKHNIVRVWEGYDQLGWYYTDLESHFSKVVNRQGFLVSEHGDNRAVLLAIKEMHKSE